MLPGTDETIVAVASAAGAGPRGIIRVSGPDAHRIVSAVFHETPASAKESVPFGLVAKSRAHRKEGYILLSSGAAPLPCSLMCWPTDRSYTGQPTAEMHTIGSPPLLDLVTGHLIRAGARYAERGEFTLRAFLHGKIDLVQAEAVAGVIDAADHEELQTALTQLGGAVTNRLRRVRDEMLRLLGDLEAGLDFVEEDIEFVSTDEVLRRLAATRQVLEALQNDSVSRLPSGHLPRIVLAGLPNAGKSTLFNMLAGRAAAIVSNTPGTTRDYLSTVVQISGQNLMLIDTAGWESVTDLITDSAQRLKKDQIQQADLVLWCLAADTSETERRVSMEAREAVVESAALLLDVITCCDRSPAADDLVQRQGVIAVSSVTGTGIPILRQEIVRLIQRNSSPRSGLLSSTAVRCRESIRTALDSVGTAEIAVREHRGDEIVAYELRSALQQLSVILGEVYTDDILDHIFSNFCIGK